VILRSKKIKSQNRKHGKHVQAKSAECKMIAEIGGKKTRKDNSNNLANMQQMYVCGCVYGVSWGLQDNRSIEKCKNFPNWESM